MRTKVFCALGLTVVLNVAGAAQKRQDADTKQPVGPKSSKTSRDTRSPVTFSAVSGLSATLDGTLDAKNAKVGDQVVLRTSETIRQDGQVVVPKGSQLIGRVTDVQRRTKDGAASRLGLVFDQLRNGGLTTPISATIVSITNAGASAALADSSLESDMSGSTMTRTSSGGSGGGLLGGVMNTVGGVLGGATQTVGGLTNTAAGTVGSTTGTVGRTLGGIQISSGASGSAQTSTTLSSPDRDIRLEKGVTFNMNVQRTGAN